jgi:hypothetical protein
VLGSLGDNLVDATDLGIAVQRRSDEVAVGPVALDLGGLAERIGPLVP